MDEVTVYALRDPRTSEIRYVGRTKNTVSERLTQHTMHASAAPLRPLNAWIIGLRAEGLRPMWEVLETCAPKDAAKRESLAILGLLAEGTKLTNVEASRPSFPIDVKAWREARGMTREQLGGALGVSPTAIYLWETGRRPQASQARTLLLALEAMDGNGPAAKESWERAALLGYKRKS